MFFETAETNLGIQIPGILRKALENIGFNNERSFLVMDSDDLSRIFNELSQNIKKISGEDRTELLTIEAKRHIKGLYSNKEEYKIPFIFEKIVTTMFQRYKQQHQPSSSFQEPSDQTTRKRPYSESSQQSRQPCLCDEMKNLPFLLYILIENALNNKNKEGKQRRYNNKIKELAAFILVRCGQQQYDFFHLNLCLPDESTIRKFMTENLEELKEGKLYFDELLSYLQMHEYDLEVGIFEDGTKINEAVEYITSRNTLTGLAMPMNGSTGLPIESVEAKTAKTIYDALQKYGKASYVQIILAMPNDSQAEPFLLGIYGTDNKFSNEDVSRKTKYIRSELAKRGIRVLMSGSDGDTKFITSQKKLLEFGSFYKYGDILLAGNLNSEYLASQDPFHILKKMKNIGFDSGTDLRLGNFIASFGFLIILSKKYSFDQHLLTNSDLDYTDRMNYKNIEKIMDDRVINLLKKMPKSEGIVAYLPKTSVKDRVKNGVFCVTFLRQWRQDLHQKYGNDSKKYFITQNAFEGIEMNLVLLIKLAIDSKAENFSRLCSQRCEEFFRTIRSYSTIESTVVNFTMNSLMKRLHKMLFVEKVMTTLNEEIKFPKVTHRLSRESNKKEVLRENEIKNIIRQGINEAIAETSKLGINCNVVNLNEFLKKVKALDGNDEIEEDEEEELENEDILGVNESVQNERENEIETTVINNLEFSNLETRNNSLIMSTNETSEITKSKLLTLLQNDKLKVSSDRKLRFISRKSSASIPLSDPPGNQDIWNGKTISKGDFIIIFKNDVVIYGCVVNFQYYKEITKSKRTFYKDSVNIDIDDLEKIGVLLLPVFRIENFQKQEVKTNTDYFGLKYYKYHAKENIDFSERVNRSILGSMIRN